MGSVEDLTNFTSAVIDDRSFGRLKAAIDRAHATDSITVLAGGTLRRRAGLLRPADAAAGHRPAGRDLLQRVLRPDPVPARLPGREFDAVLAEVDQASPYALTGSIIARDRAAVDPGESGAAVHRRQLLHQRQADRGGGRAAAVRWRAGLGHQRQGRFGGEPDALDVAALDQGDVRRVDHHRLPAPARLKAGPPSAGRSGVVSESAAGIGAPQWSARTGRHSRRWTGSGG